MMNMMMNMMNGIPARGPVRPTFVRIAVTLAALLAFGAGVATAAPVAEHSLAGVKMLSGTKVLLKKFGAPTAIIVGGQSTQVLMGGVAGIPSAGFNTGQAGDFRNGGGPPPGFGGFRESERQPEQPTVIWIYDRPDGSTYEFTLSSDGRVIQIHATGTRGAIRTARGLALGDGVAAVYNQYGYPETTSLSGNVLVLTYTEQRHIAFQVIDQKIAGVVVAVVE